MATSDAKPEGLKLKMKRPEGEGPLPTPPEGIKLAGRRPRRVDLRRLFFILLGLGLFLLCTYSPPWADAVDPLGKHFPLTQTGKMALGLFLLAGIWWVFEVVPIGVTSIAIGVVQALFLIRDPKIAFTDFLDPSVWFIFGSIVIGMTFSKTGLTQRIAYRMLAAIGEKTSMIYLGAFVMTALLTLIMAHTAVAAAVFPLLMTIHALYDDSGRPTRFGKGLFIGMAYVAGAGSIITLLGAARGAVAIGFYNKIVGENISFMELTKYMFPIGWIMVFILWGFFMVFFRPEKKRIDGLRDKVAKLSQNLGPVKRTEILALITQGKSNADVARLTYLSPNTVKSYIRTIYRKIGVASRTQAVLWGVDHGFTPDHHRIEHWRGGP